MNVSKHPQNTQIKSFVLEGLLYKPMFDLYSAPKLYFNFSQFLYFISVSRDFIEYII